MEDMLTSVNRYWLQNHSVRLEAGHVYERLYGCTSAGISRLGVDTSRGWSHSLHCALELVSSHCTPVFVFSCGDMMDLAISLWGIIWTASPAIFLHEYFIIARPLRIRGQ